MKLIQFDPLFIRHFSTKEWPFPLHNHNHYELMFISGGSGMHQLNNTITAYSGETVFFLSPEDSHDFSIDEETSFSVIKFLPAVLKGGVNTNTTNYWDYLLNNLSRKWKPIDAQLLKRVKVIVDVMILEWMDNNERVTEVHSNLLRSLLLILDKGINNSGDNTIVNYGATTIERVQNYIHAHIYFPDKLTVKHLSNTFGISESGLKAFFKSKMEMPLTTYIGSLKLETIKGRIRNSDSTLKEIAQEFGFTDSSHFNRFFKKQTQTNPLSYKRETKKAQNQV